jgi:hypothetical protein
LTLRELRADDYAAAVAVLARNGLRSPTRGQWDYLCQGTPHREQLAGIPLGWILEDDTTGVVGTLRNISFLYEWNRRPVRVVVASAWAVDREQRHQSLALAKAHFSQPQVDLLLNTTAGDATGKAFLAFGAARVPQPSYMTRMLWITGYVPFAEQFLRERQIPAASLLRYPAAYALRVADRLRRRGGVVARGQVVRTDGFDTRFDRFWDLQRQRRDRLQAVRDSATLTWRFALERHRPLILVLGREGEMAGYLVLVRRDQRSLRRLEVADLQVLDDDGASVCALMSEALRQSGRAGIDLVALSGVNDAKRRALRALGPHVKPAAGWPLYYKAIDPTLKEALRSPEAWDLSLSDGDGLWSGVFADQAVA